MLHIVSREEELWADEAENLSGNMFHFMTMRFGFFMTRAAFLCVKG